MVISFKMRRTHDAQSVKWVNMKCVAITDTSKMLLKH